jgi:exonuclease SbcC
VRFLNVAIHALGPFADLTIDLSSREGILTAVSGPNGAGKTTLLELMLGAVYRATPTRGSLVSLSKARDSRLEVTVEAGERYTFRHLIDGVSGKAEAVVLDGAGTALTNGKVRDFDEWVSKHMPPLEVVLTSLYSAQQSGGFLEAKPSERKAVLLRLLGIERIEALAGAGRKHAQATATALDVARARLDEQVRQALDPEQARAAVVEARAEVELWERKAQAATSAINDGREAAARFELQRQQRNHWLAERDRLEQVATVAKRVCADLEKRRGELGAVLAEASEIDAACTALARLDVELADKRDAAVQLLEERAKTRARRQAREAELGELERRRAQMDEALATVEHLRALADGTERCESALIAAARVVTDAEHELQRFQAARLDTADDRIRNLRGGLKLCETNPDPASVATATLIQDDASVRQASELPAQCAAAERAYKAAVAAERAAQLELQRATGAKQRIAQAEALTADRPKVIERLREANRQLAEARDADVRADQAHAAACLEIRRRENARGPIFALAGKASRLAAARASAGQFDEQLTIERERAEFAEAELAALPPEPAVPTAVDLQCLEALLSVARGRVEQSAKRLARAEQDLERALAAAAVVEARSAEVVAIEAELADWRRLERDLGRDGLQAALIDAALPEIVGLANDLLCSAFGTRFAVDVRSQAADSKGKRLLETLDVVVIDSEKGREAAAETFSGGERAIIAEGLSLALTTLMCRQAGIERPTLIRDEAGAALDQERGPRWVNMLRRAAGQIGADRVLFVSHSPECRALADSCIELGSVDVAYAEAAQ